MAVNNLPTEDVITQSLRHATTLQDWVDRSRSLDGRIYLRNIWPRFYFPLRGPMDRVEFILQVHAFE